MTQEPIWWQRARELHAKGLSFPVIGRLCGKTGWSVSYAVNAEYRERKRGKNRAWFASHTAKRQRTPKQNKRHLIVGMARAEARATGRHIDEVLIGWKTHPRRGREVRGAGESHA